MPVFSCDSGLYFDELKEEEQPGIHVRRINGKELTDDEMIQYYSSLAKQNGGKITGRYRNAIYFIIDENHHYSSMDMSIATEPFTVTNGKHTGTYTFDGSSDDMEYEFGRAKQMFFDEFNEQATEVRRDKAIRMN